MHRSRTGTQVRKRSASLRKVTRQKNIEEQKDKEVERRRQWREKGGEGGSRRGEREGKKGGRQERGGGGRWGGEGEVGEKEGKVELEIQRETRVNSLSSGHTLYPLSSCFSQSATSSLRLMAAPQTSGYPAPSKLKTSLPCC